MKYLILLDRKFPFKSGEAFLENEIDEISSSFDKVIIIPTDASKKDKTTRNIRSNNVMVSVYENLDFKKRKYLYAISSITKLKNSNKKFSSKFDEAFYNTAVNSQFNKIKKKLNDIEFTEKDTIYIYSYWLYITAGVAVKIKEYFQNKNIKCKAFSRAHRFDIYEENRKNGYLPAREHLLNNLDYIYACSDNGTNYLKEKYPKFSKKINTAYLGTYDRGLGKKSTDNIFRIVSCSRVSDVKRINFIIESLALLDKCKFKILWTHIGGGELLTEMKKLASNKLKNIEFKFIGAISNTEVYDYYLSNPVDLFINVSSSEGLPVSIMEATSFGIPVLATDVGGTSEIVKDSESGYLLKENFEPEELREKIENIITMDEIKYKELRNSTRKLWEDKYQAKENYKKFVKDILK